MPNVEKINTEKNIFKPASSLFSSTEAVSFALSICNSLEKFEQSSKALNSGLAEHREALEKSLSKAITVTPTTISESGFAIYGTTVNHTKLVDYRGVPVKKLDQAIPLEMRFLTDGREENHWAARFMNMSFAQRKTGNFNAKTGKIDGASSQWLLSKKLFQSVGPDGELGLLATIKGLIDVSVKEQTKVLDKMHRHVRSQNAIAKKSNERAALDSLQALQPSQTDPVSGATTAAPSLSLSASRPLKAADCADAAAALKDFISGKKAQKVARSAASGGAPKP